MKFSNSFGRKVVARRVMWIRECLFFVPPSIRKFSWNWPISFSETQYDIRSQCEIVHDTAEFFRKNFLFSKINTIGQKRSKDWGLKHFLKKFVCVFCWKWPEIKTDVVIYLLVQTPYLGKFLFLIYSMKCSQPVRLQDSFVN